MYQGLKKKTFYWELINTIRKVTMVAINVFMSTLPIVYAASVAVVVLIGLIRVQIALEPYKYALNNRLEIDAMVTGTATLFCGVLFISDESSIALVVLFILTIIMILNIRFVIFWLLWMNATLVEKHEIFRVSYSVFAYMICKRKLARDLIEEQSMKFIPGLDDSAYKKNRTEVASKHKKRVKFKKRKGKLVKGSIEYKKQDTHAQKGLSKLMIKPQTKQNSKQISRHFPVLEISEESKNNSKNERYARANKFKGHKESEKLHMTSDLRRASNVFSDSRLKLGSMKSSHR